MRSQILDFLDPVSILSWVFAFRLQCYTIGGHEESGLRLLYFFITRFAAKVLNTCIAEKSKTHKRQKVDTGTSYCEAVYYLLETYEMDDKTSRTAADMRQFTQLSNKSPTVYA